jgi:uncharacterized membrane protein
MSDLYLTLKLVHILGAAVLFGTGLGIAFFMFMSHRTRDPATIAAAARTVVIADALFTATAVVVQPITGAGMALLVGFSLFHWWIVASIALHVWLDCAGCQWCGFRSSCAISPRRRRFRRFRIWFWLGWPAFLGVIAIFALMIWKPNF